MLKEELSLDEIEQINLAATAKMATRLAEEDKHLTVPEVDLELFFRAAPGKKMLDVGCGWGRYVDRFIEKDMDYFGIDYSPEMIREAIRRNPEQRFQLTSYHDLDLSFEPETFDALWACCIFGGEPKERLPQALAQLRRVLVPEGILALVMPNTFESDESLQETSLGPMYFSFWDFAEFGQALQNAGFQLAYATQRFNHGSMTYIAKKV